MTRQKHHRPNRSIASSSTSKAPTRSSKPVLQTGMDRLENTAELIAIGEMQFSDCANLDEQAQLLPMVARRRRNRLVRFIARMIAQDIARSRGP